MGDSGLVVSAVGLGCNNLGRPGTSTETLAGSHYTGERVDATIAGVTFFHQHHDMAGRGIDVDGLEVAAAAPPLPILKLPAIRGSVGAARTLGRNRFWLSVRLEP